MLCSRSICLPWMYYTTNLIYRTTLFADDGTTAYGYQSLPLAGAVVPIGLCTSQVPRGHQQENHRDCKDGCLVHVCIIPQDLIFV